jgi:hypothetical protein
MIKITLSEFDDAKAPGTRFGHKGNQRLFNSGIEIDMEGLMRAARIELSLHRDDTYDVVYLRDGRSVARQRLFPKLVPAHGLSIHLVDVPKKAIEEGFDHVRVFPVRGQDFNIGHFRIVEQESHVEDIQER